MRAPFAASRPDGRSGQSDYVASSMSMSTLLYKTPQENRDRNSLQALPFVRQSDDAARSQRLHTVRGSGLFRTLSRSQSVGSPLYLSASSHGHSPTYARPSAAERRVADAATLRLCSPRAKTPELARESALATLHGTGVGIMLGREPPWSSRPYKIVSGCSGIVGI